MRTLDKVILTISLMMVLTATYGAFQVMNKTHATVVAMISTNGGK